MVCTQNELEELPVISGKTENPNKVCSRVNDIVPMLKY